MSVIAESSPTESTIQADPVSSFNFDSLHATALSQFESTPPQEQAPSTETPVVADTPVVETPAVVDSTTTQAQLASLKDDDLVSVPVNGENVTLPWKEARAGIMRQQDYTKKQQQLSQERTQVQQEAQAIADVKTQHSAMLNLLQDEATLSKFLQAKYPHLVAKVEQAAAKLNDATSPNLSPNDIPTIGQVQELQRQHAAAMTDLMTQFETKMSQQLATTKQQAKSEIAVEQETAKLTTELQTTIDGLFNEHPYLKKINPQAEQVARYEVLKMQPGTIAESHEAFKQVIGGMVDEFKAAVAQTTKSSVLNKQTLLSNNIQPTGGVPPQPTPVKLTKDGKVDWAAATAAAMESWK